MAILAIDPGLSSGWAVYLRGKLYACGVMNLDTFAATVPLAVVSSCIIEKPTIYPKSPVPPKDIVTLTLGVGRYYEKCLQAGIRDVTLVEPRTWKGQVEKAIHHYRICKHLDANEISVIEAAGRNLAKKPRLDMLDAVGLGLYKLTGRKA